MMNVFSQMKVKTTMTYGNKHLLEWLKLETLITPSAGEDMKGLRRLHCWGEYKMVPSFEKTVG